MPEIIKKQERSCKRFAERLARVRNNIRKLDKLLGGIA